MFPWRCKQPRVPGACRAIWRAPRPPRWGQGLRTHLKRAPPARKVAPWNMFVSGFPVILQNPGSSSPEELILLLVRSFPKVMRWVFKKCDPLSSISISFTFSCYLNIRGLMFKISAGEQRLQKKRGHFMPLLVMKLETLFPVFKKKTLQNC